MTFRTTCSGLITFTRSRGPVNVSVRFICPLGCLAVVNSGAVFWQTEALHWNRGATTHSNFFFSPLPPPCAHPPTPRVCASHTAWPATFGTSFFAARLPRVFGQWHKINEDTKTTQGSELEAAGGWGVKPLGCKIAPAAVLLFQRVMVSRRSPFQ